MSPVSQMRFHVLAAAVALGAMAACGGMWCSSAQADSARLVYEQKCASCHGADGQGEVGGFEEPLYGDYTIDELAHVIERTMPEDDADSCVGEEARLLAAYIYDEFYSFEARLKKGLVALPRVELARLTVAQYQNAVADLVGRFTPAIQSSPNENGEPRRGRGRRSRENESVRESETVAAAELAAAAPGVRAEYYQSRGMSKADQLGEQRVDHHIDFDFEEGSPAEGITADEFAIIWQGSLIAEDTGHYEFRIRTENGARLYLNNDPLPERRKLRDDSAVAGQAALIDAWVNSGQMREETARVFLLGGRQYALRVEFFKYREKSSSIRLEWKPPHGTWAVLDHKHLTTADVPRVFVVDTPFPADDRSLGYEQGSSISREWLAAATDSATATAAEVVYRLPILARVDENTPDRKERLKDFVVRFAAAAFRRPLTSDEEHFCREVPFADARHPDAAVRRAILFILKSPHFLYTDLTPEGQPPSQYAIASRLSFALWDSIPDELLLEAAAAGQLSTMEQIEAQAGRMLGDPRAKAKMREFFHEWLELEDRDLAKEQEMFPEFDAAVIADLRYSLESFLDEVIWSESSDYRQLLLADYLILNQRLRKLYAAHSAGETDAAGSEPVGNPDAAGVPVEFERVSFSPDQRSGLLTHPYLLSAFSYHNNTSPIHRGVFLTRNIVGQPLKPPPVAVAFRDDEFPPELTMREKITLLTRDTACMSCHSVINPLGFALENYDAVGRWRTSDNDKPVDTTGQYTTVEGKTLDIQSARDVANFAASSESAHRAFVSKVFQHLIKQNSAAYGPDTVDQLRLQFAGDGFNMQNLMVSIAVRAAARGPASHLPAQAAESESTP